MNRGRLEEKLEPYLLVASGPDVPHAVLFCFPTEDRERSAREALERPGLEVATTTLERHRSDPLGPVWRPLRADRRMRLLDLVPEHAPRPEGFRNPDRPPDQRIGGPPRAPTEA